MSHEWLRYLALVSTSLAIITMLFRMVQTIRTGVGPLRAYVWMTVSNVLIMLSIVFENNKGDTHSELGLLGLGILAYQLIRFKPPPKITPKV